MTTAMALPGNTTSTFLTHFFGRGLEDERYVVERYKARADGDIVPILADAPKSKGRRKARRVTATLKTVKELRPAPNEIIICTALNRLPVSGGGRRPFHFPKEHRTKLHSTNPIERLNGEIKRRTATNHRSWILEVFPMARSIGRPMAVLLLSDEERSYLERQVRRRRVARSISDRCRMILRCAHGLTNKAVAAELGVHEHTVGKWRRRFLKERIEGLSDEPRPGRPRTLTDEQVAEVIERTLETTPADATHWSIRSMARESGLSHTTIRRIWAAFSVQPHRSETFKLSGDPLFVDKVRDIIGLYLSPPDRALVLCVDEKSQIQALDRSQPVLPMLPGMPERCTHDYKRHGTTSLFAALDVATGCVIGKCYRRHRAREFLDFLKEIDRCVPEGLDVHIVMDNYATHKTAAVKAWLARRAHWHIHFTPTSASWINQVERWFAELTRKQLQRGVHTSTRQLEADIRAFIEKHNEDPKPFRWTKSADDILAAVKRFCLRADQNLCHEL